MGPSGAGKSTLMDLLSKRTDPTGASAAEEALQQQQRGLNRIRPRASNQRSSDGGATTSADGSAAEGPAHHAVNMGGSTIHAGDSLKALESELLVNGAPLSRSAFMKLSAYVPQVNRAGSWVGGRRNESRGVQLVFVMRWGSP